MKIEIKHLSAYLPYNLRGILYMEDKPVDVFGITEQQVFVIGRGWFAFEDFRPILKPISDLENDYDVIKQIEKETGYTIDHLLDIDVSIYTSDPIWIQSMRVFDALNILLKNRYDIFKLIESGLAIDIKTIK